MRVVAVLSLLVALAGAVHADGDRAKAEAFFDAGRRAYNQQSFAAAAAQFELAYAELPLPAIAFSAAQAYRRQYYVDPRPEYVKRATELYKLYLKEVKTGGRVADASDGLAEMQRVLDHLVATGAVIGDLRRDLTRIAVSVSVAGQERAAMTELASLPATDANGATATLDGHPIALFEPIEVTPGQHVVAVVADGYVPVSETRRVVEGATELVSVELVPVPAHLAITIENGAKVAINGRDVGTAPLSPLDLAAGQYLIAATRRGREPVVRELTLARAESKTLDMPMTATGKRRAAPWLFGGAGVLALGSTATAIIALHYDHTMSSLDAERTTTGISPAQLSAYRGATQDRDDFRTAAVALGATAVVTAFVAAGLYYFDTPMPGERAPARALVPTAVPGGAGAAIVGRF
jgi:hypothetical protein